MKHLTLTLALVLAQHCSAAADVWKGEGSLFKLNGESEANYSLTVKNTKNGSVTESEITVALANGAIINLQCTNTAGEGESWSGLFSKMQLTGNPLRLAVKIGISYEVFDPAAISAAIAEDHYTALIVDGRRLLTDDSLESIFARLDQSRFVRAHRGAVVNLSFIKELKREGDRKFTAIMNDPQKSQIPVSRERLPHLKKFLGIN